MFDIAWSEMLVIGAVALVVIGPKDLPKALRAVGEMVGKIRRMASEFQGQFNEAMREAELHDLKKQVEDIGGSVESATKVDFNPLQTIRDEIKGAAAGSPTATVAVAGASADSSAANDSPPASSEPARLEPAAITPAPGAEPVQPAPPVDPIDPPAPVAHKGAAS